jgi:arylsulfatase A-like enzyme
MAMGQSSKKPTNIVVFLVDDLGQRDINPYGSTFYETPNINRLAKVSTRFRQAYSAAPVCSPTRASIMTGKYPQRLGLTDYLEAPNQPSKWKGNTKLLPAPFTASMNLDELTLAEAVKKNGYATFYAGKWHLGREGAWPENQGFDFNFGGTDLGGPYGGDKYFSPYGNPRLSDGPKGEHIATRLAKETATFIKDHADRPFFAYFAFYDVHTPLMAKPELIKKYEAKREALSLTAAYGKEGNRTVRLAQDSPLYAAMIETMDEAVGIVLDQLEKSGLMESTVVVFTSDNGGLSAWQNAPTSNFPLRAGKGWGYEGGIRVPLLIHTPEMSTATISDQPVISQDLFPTLLRFAKTAIPKNVDGVDITPVFNGGRIKSRDLFWHFPHYNAGPPGACIRSGNWKLIEWYEGNRLELFDLATDEPEQIDLAQKFPRKVKELKSKLDSWRKQTGCQYPTINPNFDPNKPSLR